MYRGEGETPDPRQPPNIGGSAALTGDFMNCSGSATMACLPLLSLLKVDPELQDDYDGENAAANAEGGLAQRAIPFGDIAERIKPPPTPTHELAPRRTETARSWAITPPSGNTFTTLSSPYLTGNNGQILVAANPNAGYFNLQNQFDCITGAVTDSAGPSPDLASEHLVEQNLVAYGWQYILVGSAPATTQAREYRSRLRVSPVPESLMGTNGVFRLPWNAWDGNAPQGTHAYPAPSPEREIWDAIGSVTRPEYMVNLQQTINAFKSRMMRGISGIGNDRWYDLSWDDTSEATGYGHTIEALSEIRLFVAVINYLNHPTAHAPFMASLNRIYEVMTQFDDAVARNNLNNGVPTYAGSLWREFTYHVILARTEGAQQQYRSWLWRIRDNWQAERARATSNNALATRLDEIDEVLTEIADLLNAYDPVRNPDGFTISRTGLFPDPLDD
jgi:hypothetical protein